MKINKTSSKLIKPHTPTPHELKNYKLSFLDKNVIDMNVGVVLFYKSKPKDYTQQLIESLANILVDFYPLAGRYNKNVNNIVIDCNDEGAQLVEAEVVDVELIDLIGQTEIMGLLFPDQYFKLAVDADDPLLSIQTTSFPCGGVAIAVSIPHLVFDMSSVTTFVIAWSSATASNNRMVGGRIKPSFHLSSLLPCKADGESSDQYPMEDRKVVLKRLFFDKVALAGLKSKIRPRKGGKSVTGVRVACAVVAKALIGVDRAKHGGSSRDFVMSSPVNMRGRTVVLPQPKHSCGNFAMAMLTRRVAASEAESVGIQQLYDLLGDGAHKTISDFAEILSPATDARQIYENDVQHLIKEVSTPETNVILFSDCSKFGYYEADFGWGKPVWMSVGPLPLCWTVFMSNKQGDGIEVLLHLHPDDVTYFEQDQEIKRFMIKPPVTDNATNTTIAPSRL